MAKLITKGRTKKAPKKETTTKVTTKQFHKASLESNGGGRPKGVKNGEGKKKELNKITVHRQRIFDAVIDDLAACISKTEIVRRLRSNYYFDTYGIDDCDWSDDRICRLFVEIKKRFRIDASLPRDEMRVKIMEAYFDLYDECRTEKDRTNARLILADMRKMQGFDEAEKLEITTKNLEIQIFE